MTQQPTWQWRTIEGYDPMSAIQYRALQQLNQQDAQGYIWMPLPSVNGNTINALLRKDWIVRSHPKHTPSASVYRLTSRGAKALAIYSTPTECSTYRTDGICPQCEQVPRVPALKYCRACYNENKRKMYHRLKRKDGWGRNKGGICPDCNERERHTTASGTTYAYCQPCKRRRQREYYAKKIAENPDYRKQWQ